MRRRGQHIDDLDMLRAGGTPILLGGVYAPSILGTLLREFSFGHARQLESVLREHLVALAGRTEVLAGLDEQAFIDIDSLLRPVYGHAKQVQSKGAASRSRPSAAHSAIPEISKSARAGQHSAGPADGYDAGYAPMFVTHCCAPWGGPAGCAVSGRTWNPSSARRLGSVWRR